jgi:hypothetical protein
VAIMSSNQRIILTSLIVVASALWSCANPHAAINDLGRVRARILDVDGQPVERAESRYVTVIPEALVEPGSHTLRVRFEPDPVSATAETLSLSVRVDAGKRYEFTVRDGALQLVEEQKER